MQISPKIIVYPRFSPLHVPTSIPKCILYLTAPKQFNFNPEFYK